MNTFKRMLLPALIAGLGLTLSGRVVAQSLTCTVLHTFSALGNTNGLDGAEPSGGVILSGGLLYGVAEEDGGRIGNGTLYSLETNGSNFTVLYNFTSSDLGAGPSGRLFLSNNILYDWAGGGGYSEGVIFGFNLTNSTYADLHNFATGYVDLNSIGQYEIITNTDGAVCYSGLAGTNGVLYGATETGGSNANGALFMLNTVEPGFTNIHIFSLLSSSGSNADGAMPWGGVVLAGNLLCGTTAYGGSNDAGTVFGYNINTGVFTSLYSFPAYSNTAPYGNSNGGQPWATLAAAGNTVFGTTIYGGSAGNGVVFALNTITGSFTNLHSFTNGDGSGAYGGLVVSNNTLFGTTELGGANGFGTVFKVNTDASGYAIIYNFPAAVYSSTSAHYTNSGGAEPNAILTRSGNTFYGTTTAGGINGTGVIFSLGPSPGPELVLVQSGTNVVLMWPTNATGFTLQSITNLSSTNWSTVSPAPVVVSGNYTVTNGVSGRQMFYRLSQ